VSRPRPSCLERRDEWFNAGAPQNSPTFQPLAECLVVRQTPSLLLRSRPLAFGVGIAQQCSTHRREQLGRLLADAGLVCCLTPRTSCRGGTHMAPWRRSTSDSIRRRIAHVRFSSRRRAQAYIGCRVTRRQCPSLQTLLNPVILCQADCLRATASGQHGTPRRGIRRAPYTIPLPARSGEQLLPG
jgi:hypothetical protein